MQTTLVYAKSSHHSRKDHIMTQTQQTDQFGNNLSKQPFAKKTSSKEKMIDMIDSHNDNHQYCCMSTTV